MEDVDVEQVMAQMAIAIATREPQASNPNGVPREERAAKHDEERSALRASRSRRNQPQEQPTAACVVGLARTPEIRGDNQRKRRDAQGPGDDDIDVQPGIHSSTEPEAGIVVAAEPATRRTAWRRARL